MSVLVTAEYTRLKSAMNSGELPPVRFGVVVQVGPGDKALDDAADLLDSLAVYEPGATVVLVDDQPRRELGTVLHATPFAHAKAPHIVRNPRDGRGHPLFGGMCCGTFAGLRAARDAVVNARGEPPLFVVKLDTDSLVIAPFSHRLAELIHSRPDVGLIGAYRMTPNGTPRHFEAQAVGVKLLARRFLYSRQDRKWAGRRWPIAIRGSAARLRRLVHRAKSFGYEAGEHCQGGAYAVTRAGLDGLEATGAFADPLLWLGVRLTEDAATALHVRAAGLTLLDHVGVGGLFGVRYAGLAFQPHELIDRGYALVHSVKNDRDHDEACVRAIFRHRRAVDPVPAPLPT